MDEKEAVLEVWNATLSMQQHFNELSIKIRSLAITVLAAFLAVAGYAFKEREDGSSGWILLAAMVCWLAFYFMDRFWYHRLLRAAVKHGEAIEDTHVKLVPQIGLTKRISEGSPVLGLDAGERLTLFYLIIACLLLNVALYLLSVPNLLIGILLFESFGIVFFILLIARKSQKNRMK